MGCDNENCKCGRDTKLEAKHAKEKKEQKNKKESEKGFFGRLTEHNEKRES